MVLNQTFCQLLKCRNVYLFSSQLYQALLLHVVQHPRHVYSCLVDYPCQFFHGDMQHFIALWLLATVQQEIDELLVQTAHVVAPKLLVRYLNAVAQDIQIVEAEYFIIVQLGINVALVDCQQGDIRFG